MNMTFGRFSKHGFTLVGLLVILAVIAILAAMLLPALAGSKQKAHASTASNNLKQCGLAFRIWEADNGDQFPMAVSTRKGGTTEFNTGADTFRHFFSHVQRIWHTENFGLSQRYADGCRRFRPAERMKTSVIR